MLTYWAFERMSEIHFYSLRAKGGTGIPKRQWKICAFILCGENLHPEVIKVLIEAREK